VSLNRAHVLIARDEGNGMRKRRKRQVGTQASWQGARFAGLLPSVARSASAGR
jgi:hypothetical protein